jgi:hypothetical protein
LIANLNINTEISTLAELKNRNFLYPAHKKSKDADQTSNIKNAVV